MNGNPNLLEREKHLQKRRLKELDNVERWLCRGRGGLALENIEIMPVIIDMFLRVFKLKNRGERNAADIILKELSWSFDNLPQHFSGYRILHLSDIHIDGLWEFHEKICSIISVCEVDICVITGDFRFSTAGEIHLVLDFMKKIVPNINAKDGIFAILGNHDSAELVEPLENMGVSFLINENAYIYREESCLVFSGLDDMHYYDMADINKCITDCQKNNIDAFKILLVHSPEIIKEAEQCGYHFYLCGHTHGGQICIPGIGAVISNANCRRKFISGDWKYCEMQGYTHFGTGASCLPVRFNCQPEIVIHKLIR